MVPGWPRLSGLGLVEWLGRAAWTSSAALAAVALAAYRALFEAGARIKAESDECLER